LQQHLSSVLPVSLQSSFPLFCFSQQHVFTSLPVKVHTSLGEAADAMLATAMAASMGSHFVISLINFTSFTISQSLHLEVESKVKQLFLIVPLSAFPCRNSNADSGCRLCRVRRL
jgi:hypothetical protein